MAPHTSEHVQHFQMHHIPQSMPMHQVPVHHSHSYDPTKNIHDLSKMGPVMHVPHVQPIPNVHPAPPPPALHPLPGHLQSSLPMNSPHMMHQNIGNEGLSVFEQAREIKKARHVKNARGPKVFKPVKWDTKLTPDENIKLLPVLRLQKPETHTIGKFAKGGNHFCQLPSCPILAEKASRPLKAGKTKKAQRCKCDYYCEVCMVVLHPFPCFDVYHGRKPHSNALHTDA